MRLFSQIWSLRWRSEHFVEVGLLPTGNIPAGRIKMELFADIAPKTPENFRFIYGKPDVPKASPEITSEVYLELAELQRNEDWDTTVQLVVKAGDPKAQLLAVNDWYRLRRSLEIIKVKFNFPSNKQALHLTSRTIEMLKKG